VNDASTLMGASGSVTNGRVRNARTSTDEHIPVEGARYTLDMALSFELPPDAVRKLEAEAGRRGVRVDDVVAELAARLPEVDPLEAFIGCGSSGDTTPFDIHRARADMAGARLSGD
jgi:hypothetical protein